MLFDLETGNKKNTRPILNLDMANQFDLLVFDRIAQFYDTLTLEQEERVRYEVYPSDFCSSFSKDTLR